LFRRSSGGGTASPDLDDAAEAALDLPGDAARRIAAPPA